MGRKRNDIDNLSIINNISDNEVISSAIENVSFFMYTILADCFPEMATAECERIFYEELKTDIIAFVVGYRQDLNRGNGLSIDQTIVIRAYTEQRFFEKLSKALERCKADKMVNGIKKKIEKTDHKL